MARHKRCQVRLHADRTHARAATAVRNAERFMQVQVRHIRANKARRGDAHLGVHVCAVEVNLAAELMHHITHFTDSFFVHAVGGWVGHHDAGEFVARLLGFGAQVGQIDVAVFVARHNHHFHSCHLGRSRVGTVGRAWDQADITVAFIAAFVIVTDRQQTSVFTLRTGVRLHAERVVPGQLHQPVGELVDHHVITFRLLSRAERV